MEIGSVPEVLGRIEKVMMKGRGRWVANFDESFREYSVGDVTFDFFISGNTREKGFLVSRFFSFFLNPNYEVGFFAVSAGLENEPNSRRLRKWILAVKSCMRKAEMKWAWLVLVGSTISDSFAKQVQEAVDQAVGIAYVDVDRRQVVCSENYLGRQLKRYLRIW